MNPLGHPKHVAVSAATKLFTVLGAGLPNGPTPSRMNNFG